MSDSQQLSLRRSHLLAHAVKGLCRAYLGMIFGLALSLGTIARADQTSVQPVIPKAATYVVLNVPSEVAYRDDVLETERRASEYALEQWHLPSASAVVVMSGFNVHLKDVCPFNERLLVVSWRLGIRRPTDAGYPAQLLQAFEIDCTQNILRRAVEAAMIAQYNPYRSPPFAGMSEANFKYQQALLLTQLSTKIDHSVEIDVPLPMIEFTNAE